MAYLIQRSRLISNLGYKTETLGPRLIWTLSPTEADLFELGELDPFLRKNWWVLYKPDPDVAKIWILGPRGAKLPVNDFCRDRKIKKYS